MSTDDKKIDWVNKRMLLKTHEIRAKYVAYDSEYNNGNSGTSKTIDWNNGNIQKITITANCTLTFTAPTGSANLILKMYNNIGSADVILPINVVIDASASRNTTQHNYSILKLTYDGTNYFGVWESLAPGETYYPTSVTTEEIEQGSVAWTNASNVTASDNSYATCALASDEITYQIDAGSFNFTLPSTATIRGILVGIEKKAQKNSGGDYIVDYLVQISAGPSNLADTAHWSTTEGVTTYGGPTNLWGASSIAVTSVNYNALTVFIMATGGVAITGTNTASIDSVYVTIYYSVG